jgi:hypothetical protein
MDKMSDTQKDNQRDIMKKTDTNLQGKFGLFFKNEHHSFVVLKSEKLASALYMVTGFIPENDPLRTQLRTCALDLVSCATDREKGRGAAHEHFGSRCLEIGSMLSLAERAGLVSPMNAQILCDEYASLGAFVQSNHGQVFNDGVQVEAGLSGAAPARIGTHGQVKKTVNPPKRTSFKKTEQDKRHNDRRQKILSLFNRKERINVKDAAAAVEGCSEKTIQRELTAMVDEGVLFKEGERRWSTYRKAF